MNLRKHLHSLLILPSLSDFHMNCHDVASTSATITITALAT